MKTPFYEGILASLSTKLRLAPPTVYPQRGEQSSSLVHLKKTQYRPG
jgi:hypothetical protein